MKKRIDPGKEITNVRFKEKSQTLAWLTENAVGKVGLRPYNELRERTRMRHVESVGEWWSLSRQIGWLQLLSLVFWGAGFLYVQQPFVGGVVFFLMTGLAALFFVAAGIVDVAWISFDALGEWSMNPLSAMMLVAFVLVQLWWLSVVLPGYFVNGKFLSLRATQALAGLVILLTWIIRARVEGLFAAGALAGYQVEEEYAALICVHAAALALFLVGTLFGLLKLAYVALAGPSKESDPALTAFVGFWAGASCALALALAALGPAAGPIREKLAADAARYRAWKFERLPATLERVARVWE